MTRVYVGLGANIGERESTIRRALAELGSTPGIALLAVSAIRENDPVGYLDQPRFLNAAAALETELRPHELLARLLELELTFGRERGAGPRFGPRTLDLDLLLYGEQVVVEPGLQIPHPRLHERRFVLEPLAELAPALVVPGLGSIQGLLAKLDSD